MEETILHKPQISLLLIHTQRKIEKYTKSKTTKVQILSTEVVFSFSKNINEQIFDKTLDKNKLTFYTYVY